MQKDKNTTETKHQTTIEEKRAFQKEQGTSQRSVSYYFKGLQTLDVIFLILLIISAIMNIYISAMILRYFKLLYASCFFVMITLLITGVFVLMIKKRKLGIVCNVLLAILLGVGSFGAYRFTSLSNKVFDNTESETVMIVVKKDSSLDASSDFSGKQIAKVKIDADINEFAEELLQDEKKSGYGFQEYVSYKEAYDALLNGSVDMMIYTAQTRQRLEEDEIDSWSNIKVLIEKQRDREAVESKKVNILKDPFNILVSGVDLTSKDINEKGSSDVNILLTVNPTTKKIIMQTIPRDTWAPLPCMDGKHTKLTYAGAWGGTDCSIKAIEEYLDVEINYYAKINFQGVMDLVDALGGITINNDRAFCTAYTTREGKSSKVCFNEGENTIDGPQALIYSRIRKIFSDGDIERGRHQMEVINAVIRKFKEEPTLSHLNGLLSAIENNFTTNLDEDDMGKALELLMSLGDDLNKIDHYTIEGQFLWNTDEATFEYLYYFYPNDGQLDLVKQRIQDVFQGK